MKYKNFKKQKKLFKFFSLIIVMSLVSCVPEKASVSVSMKNKKENNKSAVITSVQIINNQLVITGQGFTGVTAIKVDGNSLTEDFNIESKSNTQIIANSMRAFSFDVSKVFNLILSDAYGSATFPIDFSICNATLNGKGFNCAITAVDKDVLSYDAVSGKWKPRAATGINYLGAFNASTNPPAPTPSPFPSAGSYYIVSADGMIGTTSFVVGDWLISNGAAWQKIGNSTLVTSVFSRTGNVVAQEGDYDLDKLTDVDLSVAPVTGKVLKYNGTHWVAGDDLSGGGAGSVVTASLADGAVTDVKIATVSASKITGTITSTQILDGTIVNADINAAAAIDYSKLNIPNTTIPYAKLNIANGDIPAAKISGLPVVTSVLSTTITDADTTHAPDGNSVYDALALKLNTSGGALTSAGTISNVPDPVMPLDVSNRQYVDTKVAKTGATMSGDLNLDTQLKLKGTTNYVTLKADSATAAYTLSLPSNAGTNGQVLTTNGSNPATLSWTTPASATGATLTGDIGGTVGANTIGAGKVTLTHLSATGTKDNTTYLRGDNTWAALKADVLGTSLTSLSLATGTAITASDSILVAMGKLQKQITDLPAGGASVLATSIVDADTTHAPDGNSVHDALVLKLDTAGGSLTGGGTISNVPDPVNPLDVSNRQYADTKVAKTGATMSGDLNLDTQLKLKGTTNYVTLKADSASAAYTLTLPVDAGTSGYVLSTNGSGILSWINPTASLTTNQQAALTINPYGTLIGNTGEIRFKELAANGTNFIALKSANNIPADVTLILPTTAGTNGQVLTTNGTTPANLTWTTIDASSSTLTGDIGGTVGANTIGAGKVTLTHLSATGTKDNTTYLRGDNTWASLEAGVLATPLTSLSLATGTAITASDSVLSAMGKLQKQITDMPGGSSPTGTADATTYHAGDNTWKAFDSSVRSATLTGLDATGITNGTSTIAATDSTLIAFNKLLFTQSDYVSKSANQTIFGSLKVNSLTGFIEVPTPIQNAEAANKLYVDTEIAKLWSSGTSGYATTANTTKTAIGIGTTTPNSTLSFDGTAARKIAMERNSIAATAGNNLTIAAGGATSGGTDKTGGDLVLSSGISTGLQTSNILFQTATAGSTGTADVTPSTKMSILGNGNVGIGDTAPNQQVSIYKTNADSILKITTDNTSTTTANYPGIEIYNFMGSPTTGNGGYPIIDILNMRGTVSNSAAIRSGELLGLIVFGGSYKTGSGGNFKEGSSIEGKAMENFSNTTAGSKLSFWTVANGSTSSQERVTVYHNGNLGVGNTTPTYKLDVSGDMNTTTVLRIAGTQICSSLGCTATSDFRLKENIKPLENSFENILKLKGVSYDWKDKKKFNDKHQIGLIAQDLEKVYPEVVVTDVSTGFKSVAYDHLIAPLIEAFKELVSRFNQTDRKIASVSAENSELKKENAAIKAYLCEKDPKAKICKSK